ncbi:DNA-binding protein [Roseateles agri]|uniref:DNA-binding protein n=1 Tax=Roseateles agri TaxID=3098619 RepID=UPI002A5AA7FD|nr:DNA-binding protein [Paucibacter sp. R3-3]
MKAPRSIQAPDADADYPPLETVTRPTVGTAAAAYYLNRKPETLRGWAANGSPIRALRINGRLAWPVAELRRVLEIAA